MASLLLGVLVAITGTFLHSTWWGPVPGGLLVGLTGTAAVFVTAGWWARSRAGVITAALGWIIVVTLAGVRRPEGDLLLTGGYLTDHVWLWGGVVVALVALTLPYSWLPREIPMSRSSRTQAGPGSP